MKEIAKIDDLTGFTRLVVHAERYLFGVASHGYVSVFEIKSLGK
jgi:hypothetical protein